MHVFYRQAVNAVWEKLEQSSHFEGNQSPDPRTRMPLRKQNVIEQRSVRSVPYPGMSGQLNLLVGFGNPDAAPGLVHDPVAAPWLNCLPLTRSWEAYQRLSTLGGLHSYQLYLD